MYFRVNQLSLAVMLGLSTHIIQAEEILLTPVIVQDSAQTNAPFTASSINQDDIKVNHPATADSASLLSNTPGVSINQTGGVSSLPAIRGLADDRLRIKVDGMDLTATCPNHMNPPLSYIAPENIEIIDVYAGVSPVSQGGDSIGGSIIVQTTQPKFASSNEENTSSGQIGTYYRSNNDATGINVSAEAASKQASIKYSGSWSKADNYKAGDDFKNGVIAGPGQDDTFTGRPGHTVALDEVASTAYETQNHSLDFAYDNGENLFDIKLGYQNMPEQLYPNQRMDLLDNEQKRINLGWLTQFDWGELESRAYYETVDHFMDFGPDKRFWYGGMSNMPEPGSPCSPLAGGMMGCAAGMPMYSESETTGLTFKANYEMSNQELLKLGAEFLFYRLDDYWTASGANMWPGTFLNINNGKRDRYALFAEWENRQSQKWLTTLGIRYEHVISDADDVRGYSDTMGVGSFMMTNADATAFNNADHKKTDNNIDLSALAQYQHDDNLDIALGFARKVRSPNLYERYTWSTWQMAALMNNFVGDGNGYVGNLDLNPETAYTVSSTFDWHSSDRSWQIAATPFYTYVEDYIDAVKVKDTMNSTFDILKYENQSASLYGIDLSGEMELGKNDWGNWKLSALVNYTIGENQDTGDNLYNIMPLNGKFTLNQAYKGWDNSLEWVVVDSKDDVNAVRNEIETAGYGLLNLRASHQWDTVQINFGVENIFDRLYYLPTGGTYVAQGSTMTTDPDMNAPVWGTAVPGMGRSIYAGLRVNF